MSATDLINIKRDFTLCVKPSASRRNDSNFVRSVAETFDLDHTKAAAIGPIDLPFGTTFVVPFQKVTTARFLYIEADGEIELIFDGGAEFQTIKPPKTPSGQTARLARLIGDFEFTSLSIRNPAASGDPLCVTGYVIGD